PPFCVLDCIFSIGLPWLFVYQKMVPMKSRWLPSTPNIIEPKKRVFTPLVFYLVNFCGRHMIISELLAPPRLAFLLRSHVRGQK
ncbi:hypothetical protein, partial [Aerococcus mictus]|uniref:hypothetical protein n=1 Tax=Aerococcus mictus TaxID=2976810 RepID=UPI001CD5AEAD